MFIQPINHSMKLKSCTNNGFYYSSETKQEIKYLIDREVRQGQKLSFHFNNVSFNQHHLSKCIINHGTHNIAYFCITDPHEKMGIQVYQRDNLLIVSKACKNGQHKYNEPGVSCALVYLESV